MRMLLLAFGLNLFPLMATAAPPPAPQTLVIVACRVQDLTGMPGRHDPAMAARDWRDLELIINSNNEYECKREVVPLEDAAIYQGLPPLASDFSNHTQCSRVAAGFAPQWNDQNPGYAVVAIGCPTPLFSDAGTPDDKSDDYVVGFKLPECPRYRPGTENRMKCRFDASHV